MMIATQILQTLDEALLLSRQMLADSKGEAWPELLAHAELRQEKMHWLMQQVWPTDDWLPVEREKGAALLTELLHYNSEIADVAGAWHAELRTILTQARLSSRISNTYAGNAE